MKKLSIIIPVYNEERTVGELLDRVLAAPLSLHKEIIIVDDGSTDSGSAIIEKWVVDNRGKAAVKFIRKANGGKGSAVRAGIAASTGDVVIIQDADLEYNPCDHEKCAMPIINGECSVVYGSRERYSANRANSSWMFYLGGLSVTMFFNMIYGSMLTDEPCCYKTFDGELIRSLPFRHDGFGWEPEITGKILKQGIRIHEVPVEYHPRKVCENKKIKWSDGLAAFGIALLERLRPAGFLRRRLISAAPSLASGLRSERSYCRILAAVFVAALALRLAMALPALLEPSMLMRPDSFGYLQIAEAIHHGDDIFRAGCPTCLEFSVQRPPLYPAFIAFFMTFGGLLAAAVGGILLGSLIVYPAAAAARLLGGRTAGLIAAAFVALNLTAIADSPLILADTLFAFLVAYQVFFFVRLWRYRRLFDYCWGILFALIACLVKPANLPFVVVIAPVMALLFLRPRWKIAAALAVTAVGFVMIPGPWMLRNSMLGAGFVLDGNTGNTMLHNAGAVISRAEKRDTNTVLRELFAAASERIGAIPESKRTMKASESVKREIYWEILRKYPLDAAIVHLPQYGTLLPDLPGALENLGITSHGRGTLGVMRSEGLYAGLRHYLGGRGLSAVLPFLPLLLVTLAMYLLCFCNIVRLAFRREWLLLVVFAACALSYIVLPGPVIMPRYALPALVMIAAFAADAAAVWLRRK